MGEAMMGYIGDPPVSHPYGTRAGMESILPTAEDVRVWNTSPSPSLEGNVSVTLAAHQWAGVMAALRIAAVVTERPGIPALAHKAIITQIEAAK